ncbi:MAG: hypothetical protein WCV70_00950 [Patescibacteria group bacterium]|jgi:hypothetical protein
MKKTQKIIGLLLALLLVTGCAAKNMTVKESFELPPNPNSVLIQTEKGKQAIVPEKKPYVAYLIPVNPILEFASRFGIRQDLYLEEKGSKPEKLSGENYIGTKIPWGTKLHILVTDFNNKINMDRKGYIGSRDQAGQLRQYGLDGKTVYGQYEERFNWGKIKSLKESGVIRLEVQPDDANDKLISESLNKIAAQVDKLNIPNLTERVLRKIGVITSQDLIIGLGLVPRVEGLIFMFGVRIFPVIMEIAGAGEPNGPHLEQSVITNYDLGKTLAEEIAPIKSMMAERDEVQVREYLKILAEHNRVLKAQEALQQQYQLRLEENKKP